MISGLAHPRSHTAQAFYALTSLNQLRTREHPSLHLFLLLCIFNQKSCRNPHAVRTMDAETGDGRRASHSALLCGRERFQTGISGPALQSLGERVFFFFFQARSFEGAAGVELGRRDPDSRAGWEGEKCCHRTQVSPSETWLKRAWLLILLLQLRSRRKGFMSSQPRSFQPPNPWLPHCRSRVCSYQEGVYTMEEKN